jgi:Tol biopolymer transport system component
VSTDKVESLKPMALSAGTRLGAYEILAPIGAGGMGEVYRARDSKLGRDVAVKVLPAALANDADYMARFQREAQVLAALNHPNIAHIYGLEESDGGRALAMELVEGPTLEERIRQKPLALNEALGIAKQIAEALEAAHERGIVHRDLKPANVKVTPEGVVKVLDFGLAKTADAGNTSGEAVNSPTLTMRATQAGIILGTAGYMAPEQAAGKPVDKRADIWSFGVVLSEMLTGRQMFEGETISHTLAHVLTATLDFSRLPATTPAVIRDLLRRCLDRDVKTRLQAIGEARIVIQRWLTNPMSETAVVGIAPSRSRFGWVVAAVVSLTLAALAFIHFREKPPVAEVVRFQIPAPEKNHFAFGAYLSPDGYRIAFPATSQDGRTVLWIHSLDSLESRPLAGTEGVIDPLFWSPDSRFIGFTVSRKLKKVDASGGPPQTVCDLPRPWRGGAWSRNGVIVFAVAGQGLMRVSEDGGAASPLTTLDSSRQEVYHAVSSFLADGRHFVYQRFSTAVEKSGIYLGSLDGKPEQQGSKRLVATDSSAAYAPSADAALGHLLFVREGSLIAQAFDARRLELAGEAVPITEDLPDLGPPTFSVSATDVLAYRTAVAAGISTTQLTWFDRAGKMLGTIGEPGQYPTVALSPDGTRVAVSRNDPQAEGRGGSRGNTDIWLYEFSRGTSARLTFDPGSDWMAVWSPDGRRIIFSSNRDGYMNLYQKVSSGAGNEEVLLKSNEAKFAYDWSQDGRFLLYRVVVGQKSDLWVLPLTGEGHKPMPYLQSESNAHQARFSPDSRWIAYTSAESGKSEVYVRPFPTASGGKWMVSKGGGGQPRWRRDGKELFYISADSKMMAVEVAAASRTFQPGIPKALFAAPISGGAAITNTTRYDVTADGKKFLIDSLPTETTSAQSSPITVVLNWQAGLKK